MPGDVQGNTTNVISNQRGADINHDGNDKKILIEDGAEKKTDEISEMKLISFAEYNALKDEEKTKYVRYNPSLQSMAYAQWLATQKRAIAGFNDIGPALEKMAVVQDLPIRDLTEQIAPVANTIKTSTDTINSLTSAPIIGQLASPVFDVVLGLAKMCGFLYSMVVNPINMFDAYKDAVDSMDMSNYKELFKPAEGTPDINTILTEEETKMDKVVIPDKEIKNLYENQKIVVKKQFNDVVKDVGQTYTDAVTAVGNVKDAMDMMDTVMGGFTLGTATSAKKMFELAYKKSKQEYTKDYTKKANDLAEKINGFESKIPVKYIKAEDLDKIKVIEKTIDKKTNDSIFAFSSDNQEGPSQEELNAEYNAVKERELANSRKLQEKANAVKDLTTKQSQLDDALEKVESNNRIINNATSSENDKIAAIAENNTLVNVTIPTLRNQIATLKTKVTNLAAELQALMNTENS